MNIYKMSWITIQKIYGTKIVKKNIYMLMKTLKFKKAWYTFWSVSESELMRFFMRFLVYNGHCVWVMLSAE